MAKMSFGLGIDVVEISRIEKLLKNERFLSRFFSEREREYFLVRSNEAQTVAANFAGKEAFLKAARLGLGSVKLCEIEILRERSGAPYVLLNGKAKQKADETGISQIQVSLTHDGPVAAAVVQIVKE